MKQSGLPIPFIKFIPKIFKEDVKAIALSNRVDTHLAEWEKDVLSVAQLYRPDETREIILSELDYCIEAGVRNDDSEVIKRKKIESAIASHKIRGTWELSAKILIDNITGLDAQFYDETLEDDAILCGDGIVPYDSAAYWFALGCDGLDDGLGVRLLTDGTEVMLAGVLYIDCHYGIHVSTLTAAQIAKIVDELRTEIVPAYYKVYLGYIDAVGDWQYYAGGEIS